MGAHRRALGSFAGIVALVAAVTGAGLVPAGAATTAPSVTVTPHVGLKPGQKVAVAGKGFAAKTVVVAVECLQGTTDPSTCDLGNLAIATTDASGAFTTTFTVHRTLLDFDSFEDCLTQACELVVSPGDIFDTSATKPIAFDPNAPLPPTSLTTKPATKLLDTETLKVLGTGFSLNAGPVDGIEVVECITAKLVCGPAASEPVPGANGRLSTVFSVRREISTGPGKRFDCAKRRGACELIALDELDVDYFATAPLAFDASVAPPPPASLVVRPRTDLPPYARVTITGQHWNPNDSLFMLECAGHAMTACAFLDTFAMADSGGAFQVAPMLEREVPNFLDPLGAPVDCAKVKSGCDLIVQDSVGDTVVAPLTFDPNAPIPPPASISATPAPPYHDGQVLKVKGADFPPRALYQLLECAESPTEGICVGFLGGAEATTAKGSLATTFPVLSNFAEFGDGTDCAKANTTCTLEVDSEGGVSAVLPLTFAKAGTAAPAAALAGATVTVRTRSAWLAAATSPTAMARSAIPRPKVTSATQ